MNCTQCGARLEAGQRFCIECGAPVENAPVPPENKPELDLSAYFDDAPRGNRRQASGPELQPINPSRPAKAARPQTQTQNNRKNTAAKSDRGLNIALMICGMLLIAVLVFMLFLLLWPRDSASQTQAAVSPAPVVTQDPQSLVVPTPDGGTTGTDAPAPTATVDTPIVVITPSPLPTQAQPTPVIPSTPSPTPGAVAVVTPSPTPGPDYLLPGSDSHYLTEADLKGLSHEELCFARNEIFARHGRIFKTPQIAAYFNSKSWYHGTISPDKFDDSVLNKYEWANVNFIREYENKYYGGSYY